MTRVLRARVRARKHDENDEPVNTMRKRKLPEKDTLANLKKPKKLSYSPSLTLGEEISETVSDNTPPNDHQARTVAADPTHTVSEEDVVPGLNKTTLDSQWVISPASCTTVHRLL